MTSFIRAALPLSILFALTRPAGPAAACAPAPPPGARVEISDEEALIVWDPATHTEHFVRRATFRSDATDFGFLVPTPTQPSLAEAPNEIFSRLRQAIEPAIVRRPSFAGVQAFSCVLSPFFLMGGRAPGEAAPAQVRVLDEQRVGGYDAVVLEASDAEALNRWLGEHGYASSPSLTGWLVPYVAARWKLTAFKIAHAPGTAEPVVSTSAVRMSFHADRPFFPYREPEQERPSARRTRLLRILFVGAGRVDLQLGNGGAAWPGTTTWAGPRDDFEYLVGAALPAGATPQKAWLTVLEDRSTMRPGHDELFFAAAADPKPIMPPPVEVDDPWHFPIIIEPILLGVVVLLYVRARRRKGRARAQAQTTGSPAANDSARSAAAGPANL